MKQSKVDICLILETISEYLYQDSDSGKLYDIDVPFLLQSLQKVSNDRIV